LTYCFSYVNERKLRWIRAKLPKKTDQFGRLSSAFLSHKTSDRRFTANIKESFFARGECERNQFRRRAAAPRTQRLLFVFEFFEDISGQGSPPHRQPAGLATRIAQN